MDQSPLDSQDIPGMKQKLNKMKEYIGVLRQLILKYLLRFECKRER